MHVMAKRRYIRGKRIASGLLLPVVIAGAVLLFAWDGRYAPWGKAALAIFMIGFFVTNFLFPVSMREWRAFERLKRYRNHQKFVAQVERKPSNRIG